MVIASPFARRSRNLAPFMAILSIQVFGLSLTSAGAPIQRAASISAEVSRMKVGQMCSSGITAPFCRLAQSSKSGVSLAREAVVRRRTALDPTRTSIAAKRACEPPFSLLV